MKEGSEAACYALPHEAEDDAALATGAPCLLRLRCGDDAGRQRWLLHLRDQLSAAARGEPSALAGLELAVAAGHAAGGAANGGAGGGPMRGQLVRDKGKELCFATLTGAMLFMCAPAQPLPSAGSRSPRPRPPHGGRRLAATAPPPAHDPTNARHGRRPPPPLA